MKLALRCHVLSLDRPLVMGVLNVTPDSFSDGGRFLAVPEAVRHAERMIADGADIIDVGGESTRPGAAEVSLREELERVIPVVAAIVATGDVPVSVDTSKPAVMTAAADAGAAMINDIRALREDGSLAAAAGTDLAVCLMHMQGTPATMQKSPHYDDLPADVIRFLESRIEACEAAGIGRERLVVDPGFGFGKNDVHNLALLARLPAFASLGLPLMVGWSRKRTLGNLTGRAPDGRMPAGIAAAVMAFERGAHIIRTHDVAETVDALKVAVAVREAGKER